MEKETEKEKYNLPDANGRFGQFGGKYAPETLMPALAELEAAYEKASLDPTFAAELAEYARDFVGRPTPLYHAKTMSRELGGAQIYFKREDLAHTGAHKINNALGQAVLAKRMGKKRIIAETGAGQHGVATATACAMLGLECEYLYGRDRHRTASPQRFSDEIAGRESDCGHGGQQDPQRCHQRGYPRLGHERADHLLPDGNVGRDAPLPDDGPRFPVGHWLRKPVASRSNNLVVCRITCWPVSAEALTPSAFSTRL